MDATTQPPRPHSCLFRRPPAGGQCRAAPSGLGETTMATGARRPSLAPNVVLIVGTAPTIPRIYS